MAYDILTGDVLDVLRTHPDHSFDACFSDPPYGLGFMGAKWDHAVPSAEVWKEVLRVCKPGAPLLAFGGTRTYHRLTCAIEDAGWEIRDCIAYLYCYGSGFPKSANISKQIDKAAGAMRKVVGTAKGHTNLTGDTYGTFTGTYAVTAPATAEAATWEGYGTALKPAYEPVVMAMAPLDGTYAQNAVTHGVAGLNIDGTRIPHADAKDLEKHKVMVDRLKSQGGSMGDSWKNSSDLSGASDVNLKGRWPANLILDEEAAAMMDEIVGDRPHNLKKDAGPNTLHWSPNGEHSNSLTFGSRGTCITRHYADTGGPSRFFYTSKVSKKERDAGCESLPHKSGGECTHREEGSAGTQSPRAGAGRTTGARNPHPTLKPLDLCRYLATLILPPNTGRERRILIPFSGSGSEMIGALLAGWEHVTGIERNPEYVAIAEARSAHSSKQARAEERTLHLPFPAEESVALWPNSNLSKPPSPSKSSPVPWSADTSARSITNPRRTPSPVAGLK